MRCGLLLVILAVVPLVTQNHADDDEEKPPTPLRPGLVVTYRSSGESAREMTAIEPVIALALKPNEAPHPFIDAENFTVRWEGQLKVLRPAEYTFAGAILGKFQLLIDGKEVLNEASPKGMLRLEPGNHAVVAEFKRYPGPAQVRLFWQSRSFYPEPVPYDVLGHLPEQESKRLPEDLRAERGRYLVEEHACIACHRLEGMGSPDAGLKYRQGPDLSRVGARIHFDWMIAWLRDPRMLEEHAVMPRLFSEGATADAEIYAVATCLSSLGGPVLGAVEGGNPNERRASAARGERLFNTVGCVVCHGEESKVYPLGAHLGAKTALPHLSRFLQNPLETHPSGRMPNMRLNGQEANDLARFLLQDPRPLALARVPDRREANVIHARLEDRPEKRAAFEKHSDEEAWRQLGEQLTIVKRCDSCHRIEALGRALPRRETASLKAVRQPAALKRGCLAEVPSDASLPRFDFNGEDRNAIRSYLANLSDGLPAPAPIHETTATLQRFQCQACHQRFGQGGLDPVLVEHLRKFESAENAEAVSPPPLTGTGGKLTKNWLQRVLIEGGQARPWMGLRMPQFGVANLAHLPAGLQASEGIDDALPLGDHLTSFVPSASEVDVEAGRKLVGKKAFGCIGCHDIAGVPSSGTRGPDLAAMNQRVRYDWYRRWLVQPQRMQPGTRMPTVFNEGRSLLDDVLQGDAGKQADAMWSYLSLGPTLPLPEGLEPPKGLVVAVKDRPVLLRTFMPDAGSRAIAVGFPKQISVAYDAAQCRLAYAWSGNFLDASPTWNDRGGNPAKVLGARFWEARRVFPWFILPRGENPDVARQAMDPAFGAGPPEGRAHDGPRKLSFKGYRTRTNSHEPTFVTQLLLADGSTAQIDETVSPRRSPAGVGVRREFALRASTTSLAWLLLGEASRPTFLTQSGTVLSLAADAAEAPESAHAVVLDGTGGRPSLTVINLAPDGARMRLVKSGSTTFVFLQVPVAQVPIAVTHWQPYRTEDRQLAGLMQEE